MSSMARADQPLGERSPRLWPGIVIVALQWALRYGLPAINADLLPVAVMGTLVAGVLFLLWWLFASRVPWRERFIGVGLFVGGLFLAKQFLHESLATAGMGMLYFVYAVPVLCLVFIAWAVLSRAFTAKARWLALVGSMAAASLLWTSVRVEGLTGDFDSDFEFRWSRSAEDRLVAEQQALGGAGSLVVGEAEWPGFRGLGRDGVVRGVRVATDWENSPPREVWRRAVGPGWSSFAVAGNLVVTHEQRGEQEVVSGYALNSGEPLWRHETQARFWEAIGGAGPRGTPLLHDGRVFSIGATGVVNALDATSGRELWSWNGAEDLGVKIPDWGISGSPIVSQDVLVAPLSGTYVGLDLNEGEVRWTWRTDGVSYSSPQPALLDGVPQLLALGSDRLAGLSAQDGSVLWQHEWAGVPIVQPRALDSTSVLLSVSEQSGIRRLSVNRSGDDWTVAEEWTTRGLKPYFNDYVEYQGHAYGFDGRILSCIDLETGERQWKGGRYGNGQLVLLEEQGLLLVQSELGDLVLVQADPSGFEEVTKAPALEGKSWNHPVLVGHRLLVRNATEMAAFDLPEA